MILFIFEKFCIEENNITIFLAYMTYPPIKCFDPIEAELRCVLDLLPFVFHISAGISLLFPLKYPRMLGCMVLLVIRIFFFWNTIAKNSHEHPAAPKPLSW